MITGIRLLFSRVKKKFARHIKGKSEKGQILLGSFSTFGTKIVGLLLQMLVSIILARSLGSAGYGIYTYSLAIINLITIPTVLGLPQVVTKNAAIYTVKHEYGLLKGLILRANQAVLLFSIVVGLSTFMILTYANAGTQESRTTVSISLLLLPLVSMKSMRMAVLKGLKKISISMWPDLIVRPLVFIVLVSALLYSRIVPLNASTVMLAQVGGTFFAFIFGIVLLNKYMPFKGTVVAAEFESRAWLYSAIPFLFLGAMQIVNKQTDIVMLGIFKSSSDVGIYRVVVQGSTLILFVYQSVNLVLVPRIAGLYAQKEIAKLQEIVRFASRITTLGTLPIAMIMIFGGSIFLKTLFGEEFSAGAHALAILAIGQLVNALTGPVGQILNMTGHERYALIGVGISAGLNVLLNLLFIPVWGLNGAALATATSTIIWNVYLMVVVKVFVGVRSFIF